MPRVALTLCVLSALVAIGCATEAPDAAEPPDRDRGSALPSGCRPAEVASLLDELFDALNRGHRAAAAALLVDREMLAMLERPAARRPLRLQSVIVGFANGLGQIEFRAAGRLGGKGAVDCETRRLVAIGLGAEHERMAPLCGGRRACARDWG